MTQNSVCTYRFDISKRDLPGKGPVKGAFFSDAVVCHEAAQYWKDQPSADQYVLEYRDQSQIFKVKFSAAEYKAYAEEGAIIGRALRQLHEQFESYAGQACYPAENVIRIGFDWDTKTPVYGIAKLRTAQPPSHFPKEKRILFISKASKEAFQSALAQVKIAQEVVGSCILLSNGMGNLIPVTQGTNIDDLEKAYSAYDDKASKFSVVSQPKKVPVKEKSLVGPVQWLKESVAYFLH